MLGEEREIYICTYINALGNVEYNRKASLLSFDKRFFGSSTKSCSVGSSIGKGPISNFSSACCNRYKIIQAQRRKLAPRINH